MSFITEIESATYLVLTEELAAPLNQVAMPSFAGDREGEQKFITWEANGVLNAVLDTVQSQANRIEPIFEQLPDLVPASVVTYPNGVKRPLLQIAHRCADPLIRYHFDNELRELKAGNSVPLAKRNPTALLFGLDVRTLWVKQQRIITSTIVASNVYRRPSGSSLNPDVDDETKQILIEKTGMKASEIGVDQVPTYTNDSGILDTTSATITRKVAFPLTLLNPYPETLKNYIKGLGLVAMLHPLPLNLRSGAELVRKSRKLEAYNDAECSVKQVALTNAYGEAIKFARDAAKAFGIGSPETLVVDIARVVSAAKGQAERKAEKKDSKKKGATTK